MDRPRATARALPPLFFLLPPPLPSSSSSSTGNGPDRRRRRRRRRGGRRRRRRRRRRRGDGGGGDHHRRRRRHRRSRPRRPPPRTTSTIIVTVFFLVRGAAGGGIRCSCPQQGISMPPGRGAARFPILSVRGGRWAGVRRSLLEISRWGSLLDFPHSLNKYSSVRMDFESVSRGVFFRTQKHKNTPFPPKKRYLFLF